MAKGSRSFVSASTQYLENTAVPVSAVPLSIAAWFFPADASSTFDLVSLENSAAASFFDLQAAAGAVKARAANGGTTGTATSSTAYAASRWHHAAAVFTGNASRSVYLNGAGKVTDTTSTTPASLNRTEVGRLLNTGTPTNYLNGKIGSIAIWNIALSDSEVALLASGVSPLKIERSALVFYAPMLGTASPEPDIVGLTSLTVNGPTPATADPSDVQWLINGTDRTTLVRKYDSEILDYDGATANTASISMRSASGFTPAEGQEVKAIYHGDVLFDGIMVAAKQTRANASARIQWRLDCTDWTRLLDRRLVLQQWTGVSVSTIVTDILSNFTSGFTSTNVQGSLASIDYRASLEAPSSVLTKLANAVGAVWKLRYDKDIYLRTTPTFTTPVTLDANNPSFFALEYERRIEAIRDRAFVTGSGSAAASGVPAGATVLPVQSALGFNSSGGTALTNAQRITYGGTALSNRAIAAPAGTFTLTASGIGGVNANSTFKYKITYNTTNGETLASAASGAIVIGSTPTTVTVRFTPTLGTVPGSLQSWNLYRSIVSSAGAGPWKQIYASIPNPFTDLATNGFLVNVDAFGGDGTIAEPTTSTAGGDVPASSTTSSSTSAGATGIAITTIGRFTSTGGIALVTVDGTVYPIKYTGITGTYGAGSITGVPATGFGSIPVAIASGAAIVNSPALVGIASSGAGSVVYSIAAGDLVSITVTRNDTTAQSALAALEGGDGIYEFAIGDSSLLADADCSTRGDAELTLGKNVQELATFRSEDQYAQAGATIAISIGGISTTLKIQQVRIGWTPQRKHPQRTVTASNVFKTLYQYLADLQTQAGRL